MVRVPTHRNPIHPGEMLLEEFLKPMDLTQRDLADAIGVPYQRINEQCSCAGCRVDCRACEARVNPDLATVPNRTNLVSLCG